MDISILRKMTHYKTDITQKKTKYTLDETHMYK